MMKKLYIIAAAVAAALLGTVAASAQETGKTVSEGYEYVDSVVYVPTASVDTSLVGRNIFNDVTVHQSKAVEDAMRNHLSRNRNRIISGYRVRIYFDNGQNSRGGSEAVLKSFQSRYPGYAAYRNYVNPYFKVTVGDFRTRSEAMQLLQSIKYEFPSAFIVKENINYPVADKAHAYDVDTVKVLRKVAAPDYFNL